MVERVIEPEPHHQAALTELVVDARRTASGGLFRYPDDGDGDGVARDWTAVDPDRDYSTTDSDAEVDALVAETYRREQLNRMLNQQRELIMMVPDQREWE